VSGTPVRSALVGGAAAAALLVAPSGAAADVAYTSTGSVGNATELGAPRAEAIRQSDDLLFVANKGTASAPASILVYDVTVSGGTLDATITDASIVDPVGVAVDQATGSIYVSNTTGIVKLRSDFSVDGSWTDPGVGGPITFDQAGNRLLVADTATNVVRSYSTTGTAGPTFDGSDGASAFTGLLGIAVNSQGDVYVVDESGDIFNDAGTSRVKRYSSSGVYKSTLPVTTSRTRGPFGSAPGTAPGAVAVRPSDDTVVISEDQNAVFYNEFPELQFFDAQDRHLSGVMMDSDPATQYDTVWGLAFSDAPRSPLYVAADVGVFFGSPFGTPAVGILRQLDRPQATVDPIIPGDVGTTSATVSGVVDPRGLQTNWHFEYRRADIADWTALPDADAGSGTTGVPTGDVTLPDLRAFSDYEVRLVATNSDGTSSSDVVDFKTRGVAPTVTTDAATQVDSDSAWLQATINPHGQRATYHFDFGTDDSYGSRAPAAAERNAGDGYAAVSRSLGLTHLSPQVTYHYRVVATNASGTEVGPDRTFTTAALAPACANASVRTAQNQAIADCRAYEMVSPRDKGGYSFGSNADPVGQLQVSGDGEHVTFAGFYPYPPSRVGSLGAYSAVRRPDQWDVSALLPTPGEHQIGNGLPGADIVFRGSTPDGSVSVYFDGSTTPGPTLALVRADGSRAVIARGTSYGSGNNGIYGAVAGQPWFAGISDDGRHVIFADSDRLIDGLPAGNEDILYEWTDTGGDGTLQVVNRDNNASLSLLDSNGAELGSTASGTGPRFDAAAGWVHAISSDASRIFFQSPAPTCTGCGSPALYVRENGQTTTLVSSAAPGYTPTNAPTSVRFLDAAADGHVAYFWANGDLVPGAPTDGAIYSYDVSNGDVALVGAAPAVGGKPPTALASEDGRHIYYERGDDVIDHSSGGDHLVSHGLVVQGGTASVNLLAGNTIFSQRGIRSDLCPSAATSVDGRYFVFSAREGTVSNVDGEFPLQVYRYDAESGAPAEPISPRYDLDGNLRDAGFPTAGSCGRGYAPPIVPRIMSDDGQRVFFSAAGALAASDGNNMFDAYRWNDGQVSLLSTGTSQNPSYVEGASASGNDAFIVTTDQLVGWDVDKQYDLYDARVGGGYPEPAPSPSGCSGDACQGPPSAPPASPTVGSIAFDGAGNDTGTTDKPNPPSGARARVKLVKKTVAGTSFGVKVTTQSKGLIVVTSPQLRKVRRSAAGAATYRLKLALTVKAKRTLKKRRTMRIRIRVAFTPSGGKAMSTTVTVTVKQPRAKRHSSPGSRKGR
jgi:hypothetical protein